MKLQPPSPADLHHQLRFDDAERGFVYSVGRCYVHDEDAADDVAQEAMLLAFRHRASFRGESHPRTWLYRIATTTALGYLRRQRRREGRVTGCDPEALARFDDATSPSAEDALVSRELADGLRCQLLALDEKYASVMRLRAEDLPEHEISRRLGLSLAVVKIRAHRARRMLREALLSGEASGRAVSAPPARGWRRSPRARACSSNMPQSGSRRAA
jgi:RNA polymerase sigma-70 factor (ECF subfamily)